MTKRRVFEIGGLIAGAVLIVFGVVAIALGVNGYYDGPRQHQGGGDHVRQRRRPGSREVRAPVGGSAGRNR